MTDVFSKDKRSSIMSANRGKGTRSTERRLRALLVSRGVSGWRINAGDVYGKPDFAFDELKLAVFVDGCFWHGCSRCRTIPTSNRTFWQNKIEGNKRRDRSVSRKLRKQGWEVIRVWEHDLRQNAKDIVPRILRIVPNPQQRPATLALRVL